MVCSLSFVPLQNMGGVVNNLLHTKNRQAWNGMERVTKTALNFRITRVHIFLSIRIKVSSQIGFQTKAGNLNLKCQNYTGN